MSFGIAIPVVGHRKGFNNTTKRVFCLSKLQAALNNKSFLTFNGVTGRITGLEREDGSGRNWNVRVQPGFTLLGFFIPWGEAKWHFCHAVYPGQSF